MLHDDRISMMNKRFFHSLTAIALGFVVSLGAMAEKTKPTLILEHGAFAGSESWGKVTQILQHDGYTVISAANPLRGVASDAEQLGALVDSLQGNVVLVGHSYGGMLISNAAVGRTKVKGLVYVGAFTPDIGESVVDLASRFPGSTLGSTLEPVKLLDGGKDLYIAPSKYHKQFCADLSGSEAAIMATYQRPIKESAILEKSAGAAWKTIPSWHIYGLADKNIPAAALNWMAKRANARKIVGLEGVSHVPQLSHATDVARIIEEAANSKE
jgi:pimeloyl-ACP methyl ester carboxylesterase